MTKSLPNNSIGLVILLGSLWGLSEAALGMGLRTCAAMVSGSIMTGVALLFLTAGWVVSRKIWSVFLMVFIAACFKMFDALLLSLPLNHGAIGNPIFAFFMEALAFVLLISILSRKITDKPTGQALFGGLSAVLAVNLFPLVKFATGVPACVAAGTGYPLSLYYIHYAVLISAACVPLGFWAGSRIKEYQSRWLLSPAAQKFDLILPPAVLILCLAFIAVLRLA
jgi:hypothetical protein